MHVSPVHGNITVFSHAAPEEYAHTQTVMQQHDEDNPEGFQQKDGEFPTENRGRRHLTSSEIR